MLLLDEPLSNLDAKIRVQVRAEIRKLQKELGITAVYVTTTRRGAGDVRPHRGLQPRKGLSGRAAQGALRAARQPVRGRFHRGQQPRRRHGALGGSPAVQAETAFGVLSAIRDATLRTGTGA